MKTFGIVMVSLCVAGAAFAKLVDWERDFDKALEKAKAEKKLVMVDVYTDWCGWCKKLDKDVYRDKRVEDKLASSFISVKINPERKRENRELAKKFGTRGFPHIVFTDAEGKKISEIGGYVPADEFLKRLESLASSAGK